MTITDSLDLAERQAELAFLRARAARLDAEISEARAKLPVTTASGPRVFEPDWKLPNRPHLSKSGEEAILAAYRDGLSQAEVARLFHITEKAAANWQRRAQATQSNRIND